ncbi:2-oxoacid:ferredoxin oxidoreductase subunit beta, partial [Nonomuraea ferruginea]|nr:2-oxoacid:ferredoxin oxidoreductase subunit beta [Nonomuraea ferruginea]
VIRAANGSLEVVPRDSVEEDRVLVHDAHNPDPSVAFALSRLDEPAFDHVPIGIFRSVDRPAYDTLMTSQLDEAVTQKGQGDLADLLMGGDTWRIG